MPPKVTLNPVWPHYVGIFSIVIALFAGIARYVLFDIADPLHCSALLSRGVWLDSAQRNWQPDGCMLHTYKPKEGAACLETREVVFVGDSVTRKLFFQFAHTLDPGLPTVPLDDDRKHQDHQLRTLTGTKISFYWDPFLNGTYIKSALASSRSSNATYNEITSPALLVLGSGLWYLRHADTSGGIPAWEANMDNIFKSLSRNPRKIADSVVMLPVEKVVPGKLSPERAATMHPSDIDAMNSDLFHRINPPVSQPTFLSAFPGHTTSINLPLVFNKMLHPAATEDGLHYSDQLVNSQATILLNLHCNDVLPKQFPFDKTCCNRYPWPNWIHFVILLTVTASVPFLCYRASSGDLQQLLPNAMSQTIAPYLAMSGGLTLVYLADRSWYWLKEQKHFSPWTFGVLCVLALTCGLATTRRADNDLGFLNRDQTDEWKGWMQVAILIYHYLGASKISGIYNPIRVLVASYLFMTGYGHTTFYLRKADFGFLRIAQVLIRLNLLTILLAYVMDTDYISYYFSPLVSMWYMIIYCTMAVGSQFNGRTPVLLVKIFLSAALVTWFMREKWPLEALFGFLEQAFSIRWSAREWSFRVNLDLWIVYVGMLASVAVIKIREYRLPDHHLWPLATKGAIGGSIIGLIWFFAFELLQESKFTYNLWHPYISFIPVLAFVVLRNANVILRSTSSAAFAFIGKCSLETFILQYHFWLAGDTKGVLLVIPGTRWRPVNFVVTSIMFIYLSDRMAYGTGELTARICGKAPSQALPFPNITVTEARPASSSHQADVDSDSGQELSIPLNPYPRPVLKDADGHLLPPEPDTPIRPRGWLHRLAEGSRPPSPTPINPSTYMRQVYDFTGTLKGKTMISLLVMWLVNILWSYA